MLDVTGKLDAALEPEPADRAAHRVTAALLVADEHEPEVAVDERERLDRGQGPPEARPADEERELVHVRSRPVRPEIGASPEG